MSKTLSNSALVSFLLIFAGHALPQKQAAHDRRSSGDTKPEQNLKGSYS